MFFFLFSDKFLQIRDERLIHFIYFIPFQFSNLSTQNYSFIIIKWCLMNDSAIFWSMYLWIQYISSRVMNIIYDFLFSPHHISLHVNQRIVFYAGLNAIWCEWCWCWCLCWWWWLWWWLAVYWCVFKENVIYGKLIISSKI